MAMKDDLQEIERELVESFREYKKLGKYHYSPELKRKVFDAYNLKITPERTWFCKPNDEIITNI